MKLSDVNISIIGLGYVGLPLAVEFGKKYPTVGYDINKQRIKELESGIDKTLEVSNHDLKKATKLEYTSSSECIKQSNVFIITVPTPIDDAKRPDLKPLKKATQLVSENLKFGDVVIYESTVYPGCTEEVCVPILERISGLKFNKDFFCGYSPERVNPGDKINSLTKIKKITSGSSKQVSSFITKLYNSIITAGTYEASSIQVAEAAKVIENTQRDLNIALINELSVIFGRLGIDTLDVLEAAGSKWNFLPFRPGLVGGHCIGVDPYYLTHKAEQVNYNPQLILAGRRINDNMSIYLVKKFVQKMLQNKINVSGSVVGLYGVTFKENCPDIRNSKIFDIVEELKNWGINVIAVDPWANENEVKNEYGISLGSLNDNNFDSLIVAVGHEEFRKLKPKSLRNLCKGSNPVLADVKSIYNSEDLNDQGFTVFRL